MSLHNLVLNGRSELIVDNVIALKLEVPGSRLVTLLLGLRFPDLGKPMGYSEFLKKRKKKFLDIEPGDRSSLVGVNTISI